MANPIWSAPSFVLTADALNLFSGAVAGGVGVLPSTSMITYCQTNATSIYGQAFNIYDNFAAIKLEDGAKSIRTFL